MIYVSNGYKVVLYSYSQMHFPNVDDENIECDIRRTPDVSSQTEWQNPWNLLWLLLLEIPYLNWYCMSKYDFFFCEKYIFQPKSY